MRYNFLLGNKLLKFHIALKQYRVIYVSVTIFFFVLGWDAWQWFKLNHQDMSEAAAAGFISIYLAVIGALKYSLENSRQDNKDD
jgi:uncharacterized membrane protein YphA (DoxX/SURF4 family)